MEESCSEDRDEHEGLHRQRLQSDDEGKTTSGYEAKTVRVCPHDHVEDEGFVVQETGKVWSH